MAGNDIVSVFSLADLLRQILSYLDFYSTLELRCTSKEVEEFMRLVMGPMKLLTKKSQKDMVTDLSAGYTYIVEAINSIWSYDDESYANHREETKYGVDQRVPFPSPIDHAALNAFALFLDEIPTRFAIPRDSHGLRLYKRPGINSIII